MSDTARMWIEISFNVAYLIAVWALVILMIRRFPAVAAANKSVAKWVTIAFGLLALGDTGHVGFRAVAYALGNIEKSITLSGNPIVLVGAGAFATSITVTLFYVMMVFVWQKRFEKRIGWFEWLLFAAAAVRLVMLLLPQNNWNSIEGPYPWSIYRNIPLAVQGLGLVYIIFRDALKKHDRPFLWIAVMILVSFACYAPVILFVRQVPLIGMLMMPKTLAYLAVAFIGYFDLYPKKA